MGTSCVVLFAIVFAFCPMFAHRISQLFSQFISQTSSHLRPRGAHTSDNILQYEGAVWNEVGTKLVRSWYAVGTKLGRSWDEVGTKLGRSWDEVGTKFGAETTGEVPITFHKQSQPSKPSRLKDSGILLIFQFLFFNKGRILS